MPPEQENNQNPINENNTPAEKIVQPNPIMNPTGADTHVNIDGSTEIGYEKPSEKPKGLRTYASDMAEAVRTNEMSVVKIAMAEKKKQEQNYENFSPTSGKNLFFTYASIFLIVCAVGVAGYFFFKNRNIIPKVATNNNEIKSIVYSDDSKGFDVTGVSKEGLGQTIKNEVVKPTSAPGDIINLYFSQTINAKRYLLDSESFLNMLGSSAPGSFIRSIGKEFMLGIHQAQKPEPFLVFTVNSYENAFSGMLEWEKKIMDNFFLMYNISIGGDQAYLLTKKFEDKVVQNQDVRVLNDIKGDSVLLYSFIGNNKYLVITTNEITLVEIMARLNAGKIKQ
jgi:hypothetical protein